MRSLGPSLAMLMVCGLSACATDVCATYAGKTCISLEVRGASGLRVDELVLSAEGFPLDRAVTAEADHAIKALPVSVAVLPGDGYAGEFRLHLSAFLLSVEIGRASTPTTSVSSGGHVAVVAELGPSMDEDLATPDLGDRDAADGATPLDLAPPADLAPGPPIDSECDLPANAWTQTTKSNPSCAARVVQLVDTALFTGSRIGIARAPDGQLGVSYGDYVGGPDQIVLKGASFSDATIPLVVSKATLGGEFIGDRQGASPSIAATADGVFHLCYLDASDGVQELRYLQLSAAGAFSPSELVAGGQGSDGHVATAAVGTDQVVCAYHNRLSNDLRARARLAGVWQAEAVVRTGMGTSLVHRGTVQLSVADGIVHLAHHAANDTGATPQYSYLSGASWLVPRTVDNATGSTTSNVGMFADVAVHGTTHSLAYFRANGGMFDLRIARFEGLTEPISYEPLVPNVAATLDYARTAMAVDPWGLLHVLLLQPSPADGAAALLYYRQRRTDAGAIEWLQDLVDYQAGAAGSAAGIDLVVDSRGRPHIAYYSTTTGQILYATRTDR